VCLRILVAIKWLLRRFWLTSDWPPSWSSWASRPARVTRTEEFSSREKGNCLERPQTRAERWRMAKRACGGLNWKIGVVIFQLLLQSCIGLYVILYYTVITRTQLVLVVPPRQHSSAVWGQPQSLRAALRSNTNAACPRGQPLTMIVVTSSRPALFGLCSLVSLSACGK